MVVQTAAAQDLVNRDPERASALLESVASTGRRALAETGRLLHLIRDEDDELGLEPAPGLAQLPALVDEFRDSGLDVDLEVGPALPALPAGLDLSAYRIAQEALTNALKYSADRAARLHVTASGASLVIASSNALSPPDSPAWVAQGWALQGWPNGSPSSAGRWSTGSRATAGSRCARRCRWWGWTGCDERGDRGRRGPGAHGPAPGAGVARDRGAG